MANRPWLKFYPNDWRADPALRMCSLAARGLWVEMLGIMHEAEPRGHLLVKGRAPTDAQLAVLVGTSTEQVTELLRELESADVFSRTRKGVIISRRMVKDEKISKEAQKLGRKGGNPTLCNIRKKSEGVNPPDKPPDKSTLKPRGQRPDKRKLKIKEKGVLEKQKQKHPPPKERINPETGKPWPDLSDMPEKFHRLDLQRGNRELRRQFWEWMYQKHGGWCSSFSWPRAGDPASGIDPLPGDKLGQELKRNAATSAKERKQG